MMHWGNYGWGMGVGWVFMILFWALVILFVNFIGPILIVGAVWTFIRFLPNNWLNKEDFVWMTKIVGNLTGHEYPSGKFNGGEKIVFWLVLVVLSSVLIVTGLVALCIVFIAANTASMAVRERAGEIAVLKRRYGYCDDCGQGFAPSQGRVVVFVRDRSAGRSGLDFDECRVPVPARARRGAGVRC